MDFGSGLGLNLSKSGASPSFMTRFGTIGAKGFSIRSGIPGLYYRKSWGKKGSGAIIGLFLMLAIGSISIIISLFYFLFVILIKLSWLCFSILFNVFCWLTLTSYDYIVYKYQKRKIN